MIAEIVAWTLLLLNGAMLWWHGSNFIEGGEWASLPPTVLHVVCIVVLAIIILI
jgi:hypothetical protein